MARDVEPPWIHPPWSRLPPLSLPPCRLFMPSASRCRTPEIASNLSPPFSNFPSVLPLSNTYLLNPLTSWESLPLSPRRNDLSMCSLGRVWLSATPWTVACQAPLSVGFLKQKFWSGLPFPSPGDLPDPGMEPPAPALAGGFFTNELPRKLTFPCPHLVFTTLSCNDKVCLSSSPASLSFLGEGNIFDNIRFFSQQELSGCDLSVQAGDLDCFIMSPESSLMPGSSEMLNKYFLNWKDLRIKNSHSQLRQNHNWIPDLFSSQLILSRPLQQLSETQSSSRLLFLRIFSLYILSTYLKSTFFHVLKHKPSLAGWKELRIFPHWSLLQPL